MHWMGFDSEFLFVKIGVRNLITFKNGHLSIHIIEHEVSVFEDYKEIVCYGKVGAILGDRNS